MFFLVKLLKIEIKIKIFIFNLIKSKKKYYFIRKLYHLIFFLTIVHKNN